MSVLQVWGREPCKIATLLGSRSCLQVHYRMQRLSEDRAGGCGTAEDLEQQQQQQRRGRGGRKAVRSSRVLSLVCWPFPPASSGAAPLIPLTLNMLPLNTACCATYLRAACLALLPC